MNPEEPTDSGWLSTRNKRKISSPAAGVKRKRSALASCRPLGWGQASACYTFTQNSPPPPELFTHTHQTSIVSFFKAASTSGKDEDVKTADDKSEGIDEEPKKILSNPDVDEAENLESNTHKNPAPLCHRPWGDNSKLGSTGRENNQVQRLEKKENGVDWCSGSPVKCTTGRSTGLFSRSPDYKSREKMYGSQGESPAFVTLELDSDGNLADLPISSLKHTCPDESINLCSQDSSIPYSSSVLEDHDLSETALSADLNSQGSRNDSCVGQTDRAVTDSEEPFTFAFLSQDPTLRTRGITPIDIRLSSRGANSTSASDDEEFTLSTQDLDSTNGNLKCSDVDSFEDESQCILDSQEMELEKNSIFPSYSEFKESSINSNISEYSEKIPPKR